MVLSTTLKPQMQLRSPFRFFPHRGAFILKPTEEETLSLTASRLCDTRLGRDGAQHCFFHQTEMTQAQRHKIYLAEDRMEWLTKDDHSWLPFLFLKKKSRMQRHEVAILTRKNSSGFLEAEVQWFYPDSRTEGTKHGRAHKGLTGKMKEVSGGS